MIFHAFYSFVFLLKLLFYKAFGRMAFLVFTIKNHIGKGVQLEFDKDSTVMFGKDIGLRNNVYLSVRGGAKLNLGNKVFINNGCNIVAHKNVTIGDKTRFGQNVLVFDHDYDYKAEGGVSAKVYKSSDIIIGRNCWIGAGSILLRGTTLGDNCVVGAGSIIKGSYPEGSIIVQKRITTVVSNQSKC